MEFEWVETEKSLSRALALEPMNVGVIGIFSSFLQCSGRIEEGLELMERAVAADPLNPVTRTDFGWRLYHARRFRRVIEEANRILERDPGFAGAYELLVVSHAVLGDWEASRNADRQYGELGGRPQWAWEAVDRGYEQGGFKGSRRTFLAAIREHDDGSISHVVRAVQACFAEEPDEAIVELNHAIRVRDPLVLGIDGFPPFDCVRSDPRFQDLLRKINWPGLKE
jgi:tetratricopeptide (TPR) repeat protein